MVECVLVIRGGQFGREERDWIHKAVQDQVVVDAVEQGVLVL